MKKLKEKVEVVTHTYKEVIYDNTRVFAAQHGDKLSYITLSNGTLDENGDFITKDYSYTIDFNELEAMGAAGALIKFIKEECE